MSEIHINDIFNLDLNEMSDYAIKTNKMDYSNKDITMSPLEMFASERNDLLYEYIGWNKYKDKSKGKTHFAKTCPYVIQLVEYSKGKWLLVGVFEIGDTYDSANGQGDIFNLTPLERFEPYVGRLILAHKVKPGRVSPKYDYQKSHEEFTVEEIRSKKFTGEVFNGFENIHISHAQLANIVSRQEKSWESPLSSVKGIYLISDISNGKLYVGKAAGKNMIWQRWSTYAKTFHGKNKLLEKLFNEEGEQYYSKNMYFTLLETFKATTEDSFIDSRESFWKVALSTRKHGYNDNKKEAPLL